MFLTKVVQEIVFSWELKLPGNCSLSSGSQFSFFLLYQMFSVHLLYLKLYLKNRILATFSWKKELLFFKDVLEVWKRDKYIYYCFIRENNLYYVQICPVLFWKRYEFKQLRYIASLNPYILKGCLHPFMVILSPIKNPFNLSTKNKC